MNKFLKGKPLIGIIIFMIALLTFIAGQQKEDRTKIDVPISQWVKDAENDNSIIQQKEVLDEYNKYVGTFKEDNDALASLGKEWSNAKTIEQYENIAERYAAKYSIAKPHLDNFDSFIVANEKTLKNAGMNTYELKKTILDADSTYKANIQMMKNTFEKYQQQETQKSEQMQSILKLLISLL